jgi:hypothetical protein
MSTLADPSVRDACLARLARLTPSAARRWGRMTAHQMVCHLNDSFDVAAGTKHASPASSLLQRTLVKWVALRTPLPWPHGVPTRPELEQGSGGTPPAEWETDCAALNRRIAEFTNRQQFAQHPVFGTMSPSDWFIWGYRHVDHHLRQFGA